MFGLGDQTSCQATIQHSSSLPEKTHKPQSVADNCARAHTHKHTTNHHPPSRLRVMDLYQGDSIRADFDESPGCSTIPFEIPFFSSLVQVA